MTAKTNLLSNNNTKTLQTRPRNFFGLQMQQGSLFSPAKPILMIRSTREPAATQPGSYYSHPIAGRQRIRLPGVGAPSHIAVAILYQYI